MMGERVSDASELSFLPSPLSLPLSLPLPPSLSLSPPLLLSVSRPGTNRPVPATTGRFRAKREQLKRGQECLPEIQGQNRALTVLYVPSLLDSGSA